MTQKERVTRVVLRDGPGDVWRLKRDNYLEGIRKVRRPAADVTRFSVRHTAEDVRVRINFADLKKVRGFLGQGFNIKTPDTRFFLDLESSLGDPQGYAYLVETGGPDEWREVTCDHLEHTFRYKRDFVFLLIPRRCLERPRWLRVVDQTVLTVETNSGQKAFGENPHNHRVNGHYTGRIYREAT